MIRERVFRACPRRPAIYILFAVIVAMSLIVVFGNPQWSRLLYFMQSHLFNQGKPLPPSKDFTGTWNYWDGLTLIGRRTYAQGRLNGLAEYMPDGILEMRIYYMKGLMHGPVYLFYRNGQAMMEGAFNLDALDGSFRMWYSNGQLAQRGQFNRGREIGRWQVWNAQGNMIADGTYQDGVPMDGSFVRKTEWPHLPSGANIELWTAGKFVSSKK